MKRLYKILMMMALPYAMCSCDVEYDPIVIYPDVTLENSGLSAVRTVTCYAQDIYTVNMVRTEGLSRDAEFDLVIDSMLIEEYNELNQANYQQLPESYYSIDVDKISFEKSVKTASFDVEYFPEKILGMAGSVKQAEQYVIPIRCVPQTAVNSEDKSLNVIIRFTFDEPVITTEFTSEPTAMSFVSVAEAPVKTTLRATTNFNQIELDGISYESLQSDVDSYNAEHATSYVLMPESVYSFGDLVFEVQEEAGELTQELSVMCSHLDPEQVYLLPLRLKSDSYTVRQDLIGYVVATVTELQIVFNHDMKADVKNCVTNKVESFSQNVSMNAPLDVDNPLVVTYDPAEVEAYNQVNGTSYKALDASKIQIEEVAIPAGETRATVTFSVDMTDVEFESGFYLVPLTIDKSKLAVAPEEMSETVYYLFRRSLVGLWQNYWMSGNNAYPQNDSNNGGADWMESAGWRAETFDVAYIQSELNANMVDRSFDGKFRYMNPASGNGFWWGWYWCVNWDESYKGDPNKKPVEFYRNCYMNNFPNDGRFGDNMSKFEGVVRQDSYYDLETGILYLDACFYSDYTKIANYNPNDEKGSGGEIVHTRLVGPTSYEYKKSDYELPWDNWE